MPPSDGKYDPGVDGNLAGDPLDWSWPVPRHCRPSPLPSQGQQVQRERIIKDCVWNSTNITSILYKSNHALHQVPNKQKNFVWEISPKFVYPPQGFCDLGGFWGVWTLFGNQPPHPPTLAASDFPSRWKIPFPCCSVKTEEGVRVVSCLLSTHPYRHDGRLLAPQAVDLWRLVDDLEYLKSV